MGRGPNRIYHDDMSAEGEVTMAQTHERSIEDRVAALEDQRAMSADIHATLEAHTIAAANALPDHDHLTEITRLLPSGFTKFMWNLVPAVSMGIGFLGASGKLDEFTVGGLVVGPIMMTIHAWLDKEIKLKGVAS